MEPGSDLLISVENVYDLEEALLSQNSIRDFPENKEERTLAYIMGVRDFAKMLVEEIRSGNGYV